MKKQTAVSSVFLIFVLKVVSPSATKAQSLDGLEWNKTSGLGYWNFRRGYDRGVERLRLATGLKFKLANGKELPPRASDRLFLRNRMLSFARPAKNGDITDEMTLFYKDYRNARVCWWDALEIAELTLKGAPPPENDLAAVRREDAKDGCQ